MILRNVYWITYLPLICFGMSNCRETDLVNSLLEHITNHAMVITKTEKPSSIKPSSIIHELMKKNPTTVSDFEGLLTLPDNKYVQDKTQFFALKFQRKALKIIFLDATDKNGTQELLDTAKILANSTINRPPSKCVIILTNSKNNIDFPQFFRFSWEKKLLFITVVEYLQEQTCKTGLLSHRNVSIPIVHQYNPFNNSYKYEYFSAAVDLFSDKLHNLYGFPLNIAISEEAPHVMVDENYDGNNILDAIYGIDVEMSKTLAKMLNFSFNVKAIVSPNKRLTKFNATMGHVLQGILNGTLDYGFNTVNSIGIPSMYYQSNRSIGAFLYTSTISILAKQYGSYTVFVPFHGLLSILVIITCITILVLVLKFDVRVWTSHNVTKILIGRPIYPEPQKVTERIFFLCLTIIYVVFSIRMMESLLSAYYYKKTYSQLGTLNDTVNADIVPHIVDGTKQVIHQLYKNDNVLQTLAKNSKTLASYGDMKNCLFALLSDNIKSVNGCETNSLVGTEIGRSFAGDKEIRLITLVDQPIFPAWVTISHSQGSPYIGRFNRIMRKLFEAGVINLWVRDYTKGFVSSLKMDLNFTSNEQMKDPGGVNEQPLSAKKMVFYLIICYCISTIICLCEIVWSHFKTGNSVRKRRHRPANEAFKK